MSQTQLIEDYRSGSQQLRDAVAGMTAGQLDARPIAGKMSTREVVCHIADFEPVYADRMKRVIAEESPPLRGGDPDVWMQALAYDTRDLEEELAVIEAVRSQMARILRGVSDNAWSRVGIHSEAGPLTLEELLRRITNHMPHHIRFIEEKRAALSATS
ncbi:MAG: DinB family protein [Planctomycetota bacterium]|nr:DinB family protein [Planctomycetaceae bacterium]MDQ3331413.1 DinB family protein [Planctomycetota bacterium]